jgi:hypothetical protein
MKAAIILYILLTCISCEIIESTSEVFSFVPTKGFHQKKEKVKVEYYVKKFTSTLSDESNYELHGNCYIQDISIKDYDMT